MSFRVLHVDDDSDLREIVELSLSLDPSLTLASCASGDEALTVAAEWSPDLVLCDVMMPGMDGPTTLAGLRENPKTAKTPIVFMTARAESDEREQLMALGAAAIFTKPFDPMKLADMVRAQLYAAKADAVRFGFTARMHADAEMLAGYRKALDEDPRSSPVPDGLQSCVHKLSGAAGLFNFQAVSSAASAVEEAIVEQQAGRGAPGAVATSLDALLACIGREQAGDAPKIQ